MTVIIINKVLQSLYSVYLYFAHRSSKQENFLLKTYVTTHLPHMLGSMHSQHGDITTEQQLLKRTCIQYGMNCLLSVDSLYLKFDNLHYIF